MKTTAQEKLSVFRGNLILVNSANPVKLVLPEIDLAPISDKHSAVLMHHRPGALLNRLIGEIRGWNSIIPVSGWRSEQEQRELWDSSIREHGKDFTRKYVALPGCSEHQTGLAIDLGLKSEDVDFIRPDFPYSGICQTFRKRAQKYGFIQRYPQGKEHITGIAHEPWHFRYVGAPHAAIISEMSITLEEYHQFLVQFQYDKRPFTHEINGRPFHISYLAAHELDMLPEAANGFSRMISGDNMGGFIITAWRN